MGRSSLEATKARFSRAVRAAAAARAARPTGFLLFLPALAGFFCFCFLDEILPFDRLAGSPEDTLPEDPLPDVCPQTGGTTIKRASAQAKHRRSMEPEIRKIAALIPSLYAGFALPVFNGRQGESQPKSKSGPDAFRPWPHPVLPKGCLQKSLLAAASPQSSENNAPDEYATLLD
jgi:hypothetical protein